MGVKLMLIDSKSYFHLRFLPLTYLEMTMWSMENRDGMYIFDILSLSIMLYGFLFCSTCISISVGLFFVTNFNDIYLQLP